MLAPAPEARNVSTLMSALSISISFKLSTTGSIATEHAEVWILPCDSVSEPSELCALLIQIVDTVDLVS